MHDSNLELTRITRRYELVQKLGEGQQKKTFKAIDHDLGDRVVVIKLLHNKEELKDLRKEGNVAGPLYRHNNIATIFDIDDVNGLLVEEFIEGENLENVMRDHCLKGTWFKTSNALDVLRQLLAAVNYVHSLDRIHGDIKPANIMIQIDGTLKRTDFGVAKILSEDSDYTVKEGGLGSVNYAAPERLRGRHRRKQSDLFSVGIVAHQLLTQRHPFLHPSGCIQIRELTLSSRFHPSRLTDYNPNLPESLDTIVLKLLETNLRKRYKSSNQVLDDLSRVKEQAEQKFPAYDLSDLTLTVDLEDLLRGIKDLIAFTPEGPVLVVPREKLGGQRNAIMLHFIRIYVGYKTGRLDKNYLKTSEIVSLIGGMPGATAARLSELTNMGWVERTGRGEYRLTTLGVKGFLDEILPTLKALQNVVFAPDLPLLIGKLKGLIEITSEGTILVSKPELPARDAICISLLGAHVGSKLGRSTKGTLSSIDLAMITGKARKTIMNEMPILISDGLVERTSEGEYNLTTSGITKTGTIIDSIKAKGLPN